MLEVALELYSVYGEHRADALEELDEQLAGLGGGLDRGFGRSEQRVRCSLWLVRDGRMPACKVCEEGEGGIAHLQWRSRVLGPRKAHAVTEQRADGVDGLDDFGELRFVHQTKRGGEKAKQISQLKVGAVKGRVVVRGVP